MTRAQLLTAVRVAGYHDDKRTGTRLLGANRLSMATYLQAFREGRQARANGARCECLECKEAS